ncbi:MAG: hypothetical protein U1A23_03935 [Candidatus Sungbacteria bacterium]|nr:hypothetical protein [Candidatus Sungbacteria bacterium]
MFKGKIRKFVGVVLCAVMVLTALPFTSFAGEVDRKTAADPAAVLAQIEAMNLPDMPEELADGLRGGFWPQIFAGGVLLTIAYLHYKWVTDPQWVLNNPIARTLWNEIRN